MANVAAGARTSQRAMATLASLTSTSRSWLSRSGNVARGSGRRMGERQTACSMRHVWTRRRHGRIPRVMPIVAGGERLLMPPGAVVRILTLASPLEILASLAVHVCCYDTSISRVWRTDISGNVIFLGGGFRDRPLRTSAASTTPSSRDSALRLVANRRRIL